MTARQWCYVALGMVAFLLLAFALPGWIAALTRDGLTPWTDF